MWKQDGPDMLYCDGYCIWRLKPMLDPELPIVIIKERYLSIVERCNLPNLNDWPLKYLHE